MTLPKTVGKLGLRSRPVSASRVQSVVDDRCNRCASLNALIEHGVMTRRAFRSGTRLAAAHMVIDAPGVVTDRHPAKADGSTRPPFAHLVVIYQMRGVERRDGRIRLDLQRWVELHRTRPGREHCHVGCRQHRSRHYHANSNMCVSWAAVADDLLFSSI